MKRMSVDEVCGHIDRLHARSDCRWCVETSTDGAATFSTTRVVSAEARPENTEIPSASPGACQSVSSSVFNLVSLSVKMCMELEQGQLCRR